MGPTDASFSVTQIACVYGNFSMDLVSEMVENTKCSQYNYKIIDIAPVQLKNTKNKMDQFIADKDSNSSVEVKIDLHQMNSANMERMSDATEDITYLFFLLHEQPKDVRLKTLEETMRITRENGKIVI